MHNSVRAEAPFFQPQKHVGRLLMLIHVNADNKSALKARKKFSAAFSAKTPCPMID
jgi:hypothetical protein